MKHKTDKPRKPYGGPVWTHIAMLRKQQDALAEIVMTHGRALQQIIGALQASAPIPDTIQVPTTEQIQLVTTTKEKK